MNNSVITSLTLKQRALHNAINGAGSGATEDGRHCDSHVEDAKDSLQRASNAISIVTPGRNLHMLHFYYRKLERTVCSINTQSSKQRNHLQETLTYLMHPYFLDFFFRN
jgi:hypothetical protein